MVSFGVLYVLLASRAALSFGAVHEQLKAVPEGWTKVNNAANDTKLTLSVALVRQNIDQLESKLMSLSTPGNSDYGKWMDSDEIDSTFPTVSDSEVVNWLNSQGVGQVHRDGSLVNFATDVGTANKLLDATFAWYQKGSVRKLRTTKYSLPDNIKNLVDLVSPTTFFGNERLPRSLPHFPVPSHLGPHQNQAVQPGEPTTTINPACAQAITPDCIRELYQIPLDFIPDPASGARIGYGNFLNQSSSNKDLAQFEQTFNLPPENFSVVLINGGVNDQSPTAQDGEADLDVQEIVALTNPLPVTAFITAGSPPFIPDLLEPTPADNQNEPYLQYFEHLLSLRNSELPQVISDSYGDPEQTVPEYYAKRVCNLIGLMGLRGISMLESSGDTGVGAACQSNDGNRTPQFDPQFPGTCPYVTAVGGTQFVSPENAWNASSGGFSNYFRRAWYQEDAIETYLHRHVSHETKRYFEQFTNFGGRGFPDVAAHSLYPPIAIVNNGTLVGSGGTSAASPQFASVVALLNSVRMEVGKPSLGFLNPFLYYIGHTALHDITLGGSLGCTGIDLQNGQPVPGTVPIPFASWNATPGWDPVTGLGTPNFEKLKRLVLSI